MEKRNTTTVGGLFFFLSLFRFSLPFYLSLSLFHAIFFLFSVPLFFSLCRGWKSGWRKRDKTPWNEKTMEESHPRSRHLLASDLRLSLTRPEESRFHVGSLLNEGEGEKEPARGWRISFGDSNSFLRLITYHYGWRENDRPMKEVLYQLDTIARLSMRSSNSDFISFFA